TLNVSGSLVLKLTSQPSSLTGQRLLAPGGVPLSAIAPSVGTGTSGVTAKGGSGGVGDFNFPSATLTETSSVLADVEATSLTAGGRASITAPPAPGRTPPAPTPPARPTSPPP